MTVNNIPKIALVGRPNVGKSTLFNLAAGARISIVHEESGVTRDRIMVPITRFGRPFLLVDTGGLGIFAGEKRRVELFDDLIRRQVLEIIGKADHILWMVDAQAGLHPLDRELAALLRRAARPVTVVANKADNAELEQAAVAEFAPLAFERFFPISCVHRRNTEAVFSSVADRLPAGAKASAGPESEAAPALRIAVIGRPNVGKSSLVNRLLGEERVLVSPAPGTTRDAVDSPFRIRDGDREIPAVLIDTAGMRKKRQIDSVVEYFSVVRARNAVRRSDLVLLVLDAGLPGTALDRRIAHLILEARKPCLILVNKWDLRRKQGVSEVHFLPEIRRIFGFMDYAPVLCVSARTGHGIARLLEQVATVHRALGVRVPTSLINRFLEDLKQRTPPPSRGSKPFRIYYAAMGSETPPVVTLSVNDPALCPPAYRQFLEHRIQQAFYPDSGIPVTVKLQRRHSARELEHGRRAAAAGAYRRTREHYRGVDRRKQRHLGRRKRK